MTTFNPQTDEPAPSYLNVDLSPYKSTLETVAPGIVALIKQTQAVAEPWPQTLERLTLTLEATPEQKEILMNQASRATQNLPPAPIPGTESAGLSSGMKWGLAAGALWLLLR
jgi:hypothetical protein